LFCHARLPSWALSRFRTNGTILLCTETSEIMNQNRSVFL
jgi:hypothetical protein